MIRRGHKEIEKTRSECESKDSSEEDSSEEFSGGNPGHTSVGENAG